MMRRIARRGLISRTLLLGGSDGFGDTRRKCFISGGIFGSQNTVDETDAENTTTGYRFEVLRKFPFRITGFGRSDAERSWVFARIKSYSSNALITDSQSISLGCVASGVVTANYSGCGRAQLHAWEVVTDNCPAPPAAFTPIFSDF